MSLAFYYSGGGAATSILGGAISSVTLAETEGVLFPNVTQAQAIAGITHYASIYIKNTGATTVTAGVYFSSLITRSNVYIATGITTNLTISNNVTAPVDELVFIKPQHDYAPLNIGSLAAGASKQLWLKRVVPVSAGGSIDDYLILSGVTS